eukprot:TRINITY_DN594_c0_g1_i2.p1 TRINITY_DN594_c0_g1~~TRINITY_DN594_c0_g1_i2.p1  ORF type:complete len:300 (-),score=66.19 TRINITY_DN594_c0_g1_i2:132-1031(-)
MNTCDACRAPCDALKRCTRCHAGFYCSVDCQRSDFRTHKLECDAQRRRIPRPAAHWWPVKGVQFEHSTDGIDAHVLVLLRGRGDTGDGLLKLARQFSLPQTALVVLPAPFAGASWSDAELRADDEEGAFDVREAKGISRSVSLLDSFIAALVAHRRVERGRVMVFAFAQGAQVASQLCALVDAPPLACAVCISDSLNASFLAANHFERPESQYRPTPLFVTHRRSDPLLPMFEQEADALRQLYSEHTEDFVFKTIDKSVDVLHGPVEARAMFEFLAPRMSQRHIALEEMVDKKEIQRIN